MAVVVTVIVVAVAIILWANVLHLVHASALWAALNGSIAGCCEPDDNVGVYWISGAAEILLVTEGLDGDGVFERAWLDVR